MDRDHLLAAWTLPGPWVTRSALAGANNRTSFVTSPAGTFVLRVYLNAGDPLRILVEHELLTHLAHRSLSFAVPAPIVTRSGATLISMGEDEPRFAALFPVISGSEVNPTSFGEISAYGIALGELHKALAKIEPSSSLSHERRYGKFTTVHPLVPDPIGLIESLGIGPMEKSELTALTAALDQFNAQILETLPTHIIHGDFDASNILLQDGRVSGILDFEFASVGPRAMDIAIGLWSFALALRTERDPWPIMQSFLRAYQQFGRLTPDEITALPTLVLIREVTSLLHWGGRLRQGLTTERDLVRRTRRALHLAEWIQNYRNRFVEIV